MEILETRGFWYKGNMHMHTTRSDGALDPEEAIRLYKEAGYDFIALTDHRSVNRLQEYEDFVILNGAEWDTGNLRSIPVYHIVGVGMKENMPDIYGMALYRSGRQPTPQEIIDAVNDAGGAAILAHPAWSVMTAEEMMNLRGLAGAEIYNTVSGLPWNPDRADSSIYFDIWAKNGRLVPCMAADDAHHYDGDQTRCFTMVNAPELTRNGLMYAIRRGSFYASQGPRFERISLNEGIVSVMFSPDVDLVYFVTNTPWGDNNIQKADGSCAAQYRPGRTDTFCRVVLVDRQGRKAWSSPFSLRGR